MKALVGEAPRASRARATRGSSARAGAPARSTRRCSTAPRARGSSSTKAISSPRVIPASRSCPRPWRLAQELERFGRRSAARGRARLRAVLAHQPRRERQAERPSARHLRRHRRCDCGGRSSSVSPRSRCSSSSTSPRRWAWRRAARRCSTARRCAISSPGIRATWARWRRGWSNAASPARSIRCPQCYGKVLSDTFDPRRASSTGLGTEWLIAQSYFKLHPTGRYVHSAIDALEDLLTSVPGGRLDAGRSNASKCARTCSRRCSPRRTSSAASARASPCLSRSRASSCTALGARELRRRGRREPARAGARAARRSARRAVVHRALPGGAAGDGAHRHERRHGPHRRSASSPKASRPTRTRRKSSPRKFFELGDAGVGQGDDAEALRRLDERREHSRLRRVREGIRALALTRNRPARFVIPA